MWRTTPITRMRIDFWRVKVGVLSLGVVSMYGDLMFGGGEWVF